MSRSDSIAFLPVSAGDIIPNITSSSNNNNNNSNNNEIDSCPKINNKSPIFCKVRHTISIVNPAIMPVDRIIRVIFLCIFMICSIIGTIVACLTSHRVNPYMPVAPDEPVDGRWSSWTAWSKCSITCSSVDVKYGSMTRSRLCNSPPPQLGGKNCTGKSTETDDCFNFPCPMPIHGNWSEWSEWSACSKTCRYPESAPLQVRSRLCNNPVPKDGGLKCDGDSLNQRFCDYLSQCPVDGQWGEWYIAGPCESRDQKSCALGSQRYQRQCNKPSPNAEGKPCEGIKEKLEDCWFFIGCPVTLQPPLNLHLIGNGTGLFNVSWSSVPYGKPASTYRIYKTIEDEYNREITTISEDHDALPNKKITSMDYWAIIDLRAFLSLNTFQTLAVRMSSVDFWKAESSISTPVRSKVRAVDGKWGSWSYWSDCSAKCHKESGYRTRIRECNNPSPRDGGKLCIGNSEEKVSCYGMEDNC